MNDMKKNQMKVLAVVCALLALVGMGTAIYAGFGSTVTAEGNKGLISSWSTKFNTVTSDKESQNAGNISLGDSIAPGSTGTMPITLENLSDVDAVAWIDLYNVTVSETDGSSPKPLKSYAAKFLFCKTAFDGDTCKSPIDVTGTTAHGYDTMAKATVSGINLAATSGKVTTTIYWKWVGSPMGSDGTSVDNLLAGKKITLDVSATIRQKTA